LEDVAECTVWTAGAFALSTSTLAALQNHLYDSDFGCFVFGPDDVATVKGELLKVPRDNVIFESGLFSGHLGPDRCFVAVPRSVEVHIPTDLAGMTLGFYNDTRVDGNYDGAVLTFCNQVKQRIGSLGLFQGTVYDQLRELIISFECSNWITEDGKRVDRKRVICANMEGFCRAYPPNKYRLLGLSSQGAIAMLLVAIKLKPQEQDIGIIRQIPRASLPHGFMLSKLFEVTRALKTAGKVTAAQLKDLRVWLLAGKDLDDKDRATIDDVTA
jgi:hypothetical protein